MAEYEGDILKPPGMGPERVVTAPEEIIASYNPPPLKKGGTVKAGVGVLKAGQPMKLAADNKTWTKSVLTTGTYDEVTAINETETDATSADRLVNLIFGGVINAKVSVITPTNAAALATALGGTYIETFGYIKF